MFSQNQQDILQAMGFTLYVPLPQAATPPVVNAVGLWETALGLNIRRHLQGVGVECLPLAALPADAESRRRLWRPIRNLRRAHERQ